MSLTFHPLSLERQTEYKRRLNQCPQISSDYSFVNIWAWRDIYDLEWAWTDSLVFIRQNSPQVQYWAPVGPWQDQDLATVFDLLPAALNLTRIPSQLAELLIEQLPARADLHPAPEHFDYVYDVQELIDLRGNRFHKKKNLLNQFKRSYDFTYIPLTVDAVEKALTLQTEWCLWRDCEDSTTLEAENRAILNTFDDWTQLEDVFGGGLLVEGNMVAYTVAEPLDAETVVIHFEKGCPDHKGAYQAINQMFLAHSASHFTYVNREQDLGDPGLRKAKESYNPVAYIQKYSGTLA
ncbi:MAG: phosphatidylglycerol lysyltransferase domain-containing protein [Desulfovermiculus sp.]|nr:phosphatidylglycerol lysyltransferase domain-containing protein [Desulfovermiculus sp.]